MLRRGIGHRRGKLKSGFLGSFKVKLAAALVVLAVLPLAVAYSSFTDAAGRSVMVAADGRLETGLRAAAGAFERERLAARRTAERLANEPELQRAVLQRDRAALERLLLGQPNVRVEAFGGFTAGASRPLAAAAPVALVGAGRRAATVIGLVPLDGRLLGTLFAGSGLREGDRLALVDRGGRIAASTGPELAGSLDVGHGSTATVSVRGRDLRVAAAQLVSEPEVTLVAATPWSTIAAARRAERNRLLAGLAAALVLVCAVAYAVGRSVVGSLSRLATAADGIAAGRLHERVPVRGRDEVATLSRAFNRMAAELEARVRDLEGERRRLREANHRVGEALASTLDPEELRRVIVETAVQATNAQGGVLRDDDGTIVTAGDPGAGGERLELPLSVGPGSTGSLLLLGRRFDVEATSTAASLAGQAVVALENARLHRTVERQALVDDLTGLPNRRQAEDALSDELARAARLGGFVGLVLADLDDFKLVNDRYGHPTGDDLLRAVARMLAGAVREIDLAARWGGEEFAIVLPGTDLAGAVQAAERIRAAVAGVEVTAPTGEPVRVTTSLGVAACAAGTSRDELVGAADSALYEAKRAGKDRSAAGTTAADSGHGHVVVP